MASLLRFIMMQLGLSNTPANNFTFDASADNGTMKLHRGNAGAGTQDVMTVDANGVAEFPQGAKTMLLRAAKTASGTTVDFSPADGTGVPSWAKKITVLVKGLSTSGGSLPLLQVGTSSGVVTSGYLGGGANVFNGPSITTANQTAGCLLAGNWAASSTLRALIELAHMGGNTWVIGGKGAFSNDSTNTSFSSDVSLAAVLDRIRITTVNGTDTFDAGSVSLLIEG